MPNPAEFDLGYLFKAYPGHFLFGYNKNLFPNEAYRRRFLRVYLQEYYRLNDLNTETGEFETELEDLFHKANLISILQLIKGTWLGMFFDFNQHVRFQQIRPILVQSISQIMPSSVSDVPEQRNGQRARERPVLLWWVAFQPSGDASVLWLDRLC